MRLNVSWGAATGVEHAVATADEAGMEAVTGEPGSVVVRAALALATVAELETDWGAKLAVFPADVGAEVVAARAGFWLATVEFPEGPEEATGKPAEGLERLNAREAEEATGRPAEGLEKPVAREAEEAVDGATEGLEKLNAREVEEAAEGMIAGPDEATDDATF